MGIIDFHTHAFPDAIAAKAMPALEEEAGFKAKLDGTVAGLIASMDHAGVEKSVLANIATKPSQFESILKWSKQIASDRIVPFPSVHPDDENSADHIRLIAEEGFKGVKLHPYYQEFSLNEQKAMPIYEAMEQAGLILLAHAGFDFAFERTRIADPEKIAEIHEKFPRLPIVASHLGGWEDWDMVEKHLLGKAVYMEISFALQYMNTDRARSILMNHPREYLLFGTDSPWAGQKETLDLLLGLELPDELNEAILRVNGAALLGI